MAEQRKDWAASANGATIAITEVGHAVVLRKDLAYDSNHDTASFIYGAGGGDIGTLTITLPHTISVDEFQMRVALLRVHSYVNYPTFTFQYYDGAWNTIRAWTPTETPPLQIEVKKFKDSGAEDVTEIRMVVSALWAQYYQHSLVYSMEAWGHFHEDGTDAGSDFGGGLRFYDGSDVRTIGVEALDDHALRIRDASGVTYGIPLVATDHDKACGLRIYDGTSVKAFVDIT